MLSTRDFPGIRCYHIVVGSPKESQHWGLLMAPRNFLESLYYVLVAHHRSPASHSEAEAHTENGPKGCR